jgi:lipoprotein-releasing system permease protein
MNGLQQGYIRSILEIGSYHLRWTPDIDAFGENSDGDDVADIIAEDPRVLLAVPFREGQTMLNGVRPRPAGALLRGVPETLYIEDKELAKRLDIVDGDFDVSDSGIVLGDELALELGVSPGDSVGALDLGAAGLSSSSVNLTVTGLFRCGYREYEAGMAFVSVDTSEQLFGPTPLEVGVKLTKPEKDRSVMNRMVPRLTESGGSLSSWRETNRSFFGALRTEKLMMLSRWPSSLLWYR